MYSLAIWACLFLVLAIAMVFLPTFIEVGTWLLNKIKLYFQSIKYNFKAVHAITPDMAFDLDKKDVKLLKRMKNEINRDLKNHFHFSNEPYTKQYYFKRGDENYPLNIIYNLKDSYEATGWKVTVETLDILANVKFELNNDDRKIRTEINEEIEEVLRVNRISENEKPNAVIRQNR